MFVAYYRKHLQTLQRCLRFFLSSPEESTAKAVTFGAGFHLLLSMCIWSYAKTTATAIPDVPPAYLLSVDQEQGSGQLSKRAHASWSARDAGIAERRVHSGARWFRVLLRVMPSPQAGQMPPLLHVPKMHHEDGPSLPVVQQLRLLQHLQSSSCSLSSTRLHCAYTAWPPWQPTWLNGGRTRGFGSRTLSTWASSWVVGTVLAVALGSFLVMHLFMVSKNETTLERLRDATFQELGDSFDLGNRYENFIEVFGPRKSLWMIPVFTSVGDGVRFPTRLNPTRDTVEPRASVVVVNYSAATYSMGSSGFDSRADVVDIEP
ncbi:hypothetical protein MRX96_043963 [Rhipicephalus microplus]